jgi:hypothetical protein
MNYKIIQDLESLENFISLLPECKENEMFYLSLFARSKYDVNKVGLKADKQQLKRTTATKDRIVQKLKQWETEVGNYTTASGIAIPQEVLAVYITPNPRDLHKASLNQAKNMMSSLAQGQPLGNPRSKAMNAIQVSCSHKRFFDIDIDEKDRSIFDTICGFLNKEAVSNLSLESRGGYHLLVELDKISDEHKKSWYNNIKYLIDSCDGQMNGDNMIPLVGCTQGGFTPKLINF